LRAGLHIPRLLLITTDEEVDYNYEEVFDKEEDRRRGFAVCLTDSYSLTATFLAVGVT